MRSELLGPGIPMIGGRVPLEQPAPLIRSNDVKWRDVAVRSGASSARIRVLPGENAGDPEDTRAIAGTTPDFLQDLRMIV